MGCKRIKNALFCNRDGIVPIDMLKALSINAIEIGSQFIVNFCKKKKDQKKEPFGLRTLINLDISIHTYLHYKYIYI